MKLLIIRHGEPDYTIDSLTEKGRREAELLADRLCRERIDDFYVSPLGRARDTARPTLLRLGREAGVLPWLEEFRGTIIEPNSGKRRIPWNLSPQYWTRQPEFYDRDRWTENGLYRAGDVEEVYRQTAAGLDALLEGYGYARHGGLYRCPDNGKVTVALFCHFALGMTILSYLLGVSPVVMWHGFFLPTSSVTTLVTEERVKGEVFFKCAQMGDTSHLYAAGEPVSPSGLFAECYGEPGTEEAR